MTIQEHIHKYLVNKGMFESQANAVLEAIRNDPDPLLIDLRIRLNEQAADYPEVFLAALSFTVDRCVLKWIDANLPQAWYRPMFAPQG